MTTGMKAIETEYKGYRFRSRLEARWAVFFDTAGITYEYESEGYESGGPRYLPDFWLPELGFWIEIKPASHRLNDTQKETAFALSMRDRLRALNAERGAAWDLLGPDATEEQIRELMAVDPRMAANFDVLIGDPYFDGDHWSYAHWRYHKSYTDPTYSWRDVSEHFVQCPLCERVLISHSYRNYAPDEEATYCFMCDAGDRRTGATGRGYFHKGDSIAYGLTGVTLSPLLRDAYAAARGARFEFGESGARPARHPQLPPGVTGDWRPCARCGRFTDTASSLPNGDRWCVMCAVDSIPKHLH